MDHRPCVPSFLKELPQWICWAYGPPEKSGAKPRKLPLNPHTGEMARTNDPTTWGSYWEASQAANNNRDRVSGIGFVFRAGGGLVGIDLDDCIINGQFTHRATQIVQRFASYTEISPSRQGCKIWIRATLPAWAKRRYEHSDLGCSHIEVYGGGQYFTVTGDGVDTMGGLPVSRRVEDKQDVLDAFLAWVHRLTQPSAAAPATMVGYEEGGQFRPAPPQIISAPTGPLATPPDIIERCRKYLSRVRPAVAGQGGHDRCLSAACTCYKFGLNDGEAISVLTEWNRRNSPPFDDRELLHKLKDAKAKVVEEGTWGIKVKGSTPTPRHPLPDWIRSLGLKPHSLLILQVIADRCNRHDESGSLIGCTIGAEKLGKIVGLSERTVQRHIADLEEAGALIILNKGHGGIDFHTGDITSNRYKIPGRVDDVASSATASMVHCLPPPGW